MPKANSGAPLGQGRRKSIKVKSEMKPDKKKMMAMAAKEKARTNMKRASGLAGSMPTKK